MSGAIPFFTVADSFQISGRGCVIVSDAPLAPAAPAARIGSRIRLITPAGAIIDTSVHGIEMIHHTQPPPPGKRRIGIGLAPPVTKAQVPPGTQVFLLADAVARQAGETTGAP